MNHRSSFSIVPLALLSILMAALSAGCSSTRPYTTGPIRTFDPDTARIPQPEEKEQWQYWDRIDNTIFHQLEKLLDLNRSVRFLGEVAGVAEARQADNINHLDEVPASSWYTPRHYFKAMSLQQLARGPNTVTPDTSGQWTIFQAKLEGANSGFFIEDENGNRFLVKFDGYEFPELTTSAEVISTKIFYAAGYTVPESVITYFDPEKVNIGEGVTVEDAGKERLMTHADYQTIVEGRPVNKEGKIRALASKFVDGIPLGPWNFEGTRDDDPNDRVAHEHRRELRGMRVISSWLNDTDRRDANTMSVYNDRGYIEHYVQDFGNTLGANGTSIHMPIQGQAYMIDPRYMALSAISLGLYETPWETITPQIPFPSVGYFQADLFKPGRWVPSHPIPAFENMTLRDAFWGAKLVMGFSDREIRAMVETGKLSNPEAVDYLVDTLAKRRDMIGRYWFGRMNPIDKFHPRISENNLLLDFADLMVDGDLVEPSEHRYLYDIRLADKQLIHNKVVENTQVKVDLQQLQDDKGSPPQIVQVTFYTLRDYQEGTGKKVDVYVELVNNNARIAGIDRKE